MGKKTDRTPKETETGAIKKNWAGKTSIALVYPNTYSVGMANLGFQCVYSLFNDDEETVCERVFLPEKGKPEKILSVESNRPLKDFQIVAFSLSFENDYMNVLNILHLAGLPLRSNARGDSHPLLIAGGVACLLNPEPLAPFIDAFLIGEAEALVFPFLKTIREKNNKTEILESLASDLKGIYIPSFYSVSYNSDGTLESFLPEFAGVPETVTRAFPSDISMKPTSTAVLSAAAVFESAFLTEVSRGCTHGCRFCSAGFIYRPPRYRSEQCLIDECLKASRYTDRIGLVGTAISDHPCITDVCLSPELAGLKFAYSSLRADAVTPEHLEVLVKSGTKTATIAPEAGSEKMRRVINKGISEDQIINAAQNLVESGILNIKLYFMIGLPGERHEDIEAIVHLSEKIRSVFLEASKKLGRMGQITVGVSCFVPKPSTPFQWAPMDDSGILKKKIKTLSSGINRIPNLRLSADSPRGAVVQALLSRGDRTVADMLETAFHDKGNWAKTLKTFSNATELFITRERNKNELFPWDFIDHGIRKSFLRSEYEKALKSETSPVCPVVNCSRCGVCKL